MAIWAEVTMSIVGFQLPLFLHFLLFVLSALLTLKWVQLVTIALGICWTKPDSYTWHLAANDPIKSAHPPLTEQINWAFYKLTSEVI